MQPRHAHSDAEDQGHGQADFQAQQTSLSDD
jgi:hypothetical protein